MTTAIINEIGNYLRETIEDFDVRVELALNTMDRKRCPFGYADSELCDECYDYDESRRFFVGEVTIKVQTKK